MHSMKDKDQQPVTKGTASDARSSVDLEIGVAHCLQQAGDLHGAVQAYQRVLQREPTSYAAYNNLGTLFGSLGDQKTALIFLEAAVALNPHVAEIHNNIGNLYLDAGRTRSAVESYCRAIRLEPSLACYHNHLGNGLRLLGDLAGAERAVRQALELRSDYPDAHVNLGFVLEQQGKWDEAETCYRQAIRLRPDVAVAHTNLSQVLLRRGELLEGWKEQEWRWQWKGFTSPKRNFAQPQWRGEAVENSRVLLHAEQGFGDTIQMLRYVPMLARRGATVVLEIHPELKSLVENLEGVSQLLARDEPVPECDWQCPLMSLPLAFGTAMDTIPRESPYLTANPHAPVWLGRPMHGQLHVGIVWAGNPKNLVDHRRSLSLSVLSPLFDVEGVSFCSLQRGVAYEEARACPFIASLPESADFAETAAAVSHLDLVITIDSAVAHLAGALGKPVWILLPSLSDWRWLTVQEHTPWYPSATLFRQDSQGEWSGVVQRVVAKLESEVLAKRIASVLA